MRFMFKQGKHYRGGNKRSYFLQSGPLAIILFSKMAIRHSSCLRRWSSPCKNIISTAGCSLLSWAMAQYGGGICDVSMYSEFKVTQEERLRAETNVCIFRQCNRKTVMSGLTLSWGSLWVDMIFSKCGISYDKYSGCSIPELFPCDLALSFLLVIF